jgi:hypothetical protein
LRGQASHPGAASTSPFAGREEEILDGILLEFFQTKKRRKTIKRKFKMDWLKNTKKFFQIFLQFRNFFNKKSITFLFQNTTTNLVLVPCHHPIPIFLVGGRRVHHHRRFITVAAGGTLALAGWLKITN